MQADQVILRLPEKLSERVREMMQLGYMDSIEYIATGALVYVCAAWQATPNTTAISPQMRRPL
jgi:hypothetical protein